MYVLTTMFIANANNSQKIQLESLVKHVNVMIEEHTLQIDDIQV